MSISKTCAMSALSPLADGRLLDGHDVPDALGAQVHQPPLLLNGKGAALAGKIVGHNVTYVVAFYIIDIAMVSTDLALTFRNRALDRAAER